ncbi:MAG: TerB family tellurite resistance protein [Gemmatimonadaceae bacterium]|nr:TerB family tellurite resistance protein [Gemmatimonadaceae bacterium]
MLPDRIRSMFSRAELGESLRTASPGGELDPLHLAACALLLDVAYADGEYSTEERAHIERSLERHFALSPRAIQQVMELADDERARAVDHFAFTSALLRGYDMAQKMVLAELMWGVALADGEIADHEHYLTRKISNLLNLEPGYLSAAKQSAASRVGAIEPPDDQPAGP